jgi:Uma2 family endonuclease
MDRVVIDPPRELIAERVRLGLDLFDEVWNGSYHLVPTPSGEHQRVVFDLGILLRDVARAHGLDVRHEFNLIPADEPGWEDFRVPDLVVFPPSSYAERGIVGPPTLAVEVRSPGDESFRKLPFYAHVQTAEVLIVHRDTKAIRRWVLVDGELVEAEPDGQGRHVLVTLPIVLRTEAEQLYALVDGVERRI